MYTDNNEIKEQKTQAEATSCAAGEGRLKWKHRPPQPSLDAAREPE